MSENGDYVALVVADMERLCKRYGSAADGLLQIRADRVTEHEEALRQIDQEVARLRARNEAVTWAADHLRDLGRHRLSEPSGPIQTEGRS